MDQGSNLARGRVARAWAFGSGSSAATTAGAFFDHDGNGFAEATGWVNAQDGILVRDVNGNGTIDTGRDSSARKHYSHGQKAANGYAALAELDSNGDGQINAQDAAFATLKIWKDSNGDGYSAVSELFTLADAGVQSIATGSTATNQTDINVQGEFLSAAPLTLYDRIGGTEYQFAHNPVEGVLSGFQLHSQVLLAAFQYSKDKSPAGKALNEVTFSLTDLLAMIFDPNLYAFTTDRDNTKDVNFLEHLVRHEAGVQGSIDADAMVTRFTSDLWKLAQDGGLTMSEGATLLGELNNVNQALIAFAMQKYYEETNTSAGYKQELFTDLSTAGTGNNGIQFDMADVSAKFKTAFDTNQALTLSDAKGNAYFQQYLHTGLDFTAQEQALLTSLLPYMRDWYVQAGMNGMTATDTLGRNAFIPYSLTLAEDKNLFEVLGGSGSDTLQGKAGNDTLLGGIGNDTYQYTNGDGFDTILDSDGNGIIIMDSATLAGGTQYGDERVHRDADGRLYVNVGMGLVVDGNTAAPFSINRCTMHAANDEIIYTWRITA